MRPDTLRAIAGGFVGTAVMTAMMYVVAPRIMGIEMDIAAMLGSMMGGNWTAGLIAHFMLGTVVFPVTYAVVLFGRIPGAPAVRGVIWGLMLWLLAQVVVMPMMGGGFFSRAMGGMMAVMGSLMGHVAYGALLGAIAGPARR